MGGRALNWHRRRTYDHRSFSVDGLAADRSMSVSICLPARDEAATIGPILERLLPLRDRGLVDQVVVADDSTDGTGEIAARLGAEVVEQASLLPEFGRVLGKGDAMWRALSVLHGDVVVFLDADSEQFGEHFAVGLLGPLLTDPGVLFAKGFYRRPWRTTGGTTEATGGGRVTELTARPLLKSFYPDLAAFHQPLAGEIAARADLLRTLPFATGYAVDVALLIDAWRAAGIDALAQVDLDVRQNRHRGLAELGPMAEQVLAGITSRMEREGRLAPAVGGPALLERPPMASVTDVTAASLSTSEA